MKLLPLVLAASLVSCSAMPTTRGSMANAIADRLEPVADGLSALHLLVSTVTGTLREAGAAQGALRMAVDNAGARAANNERDTRLLREEVRSLEPMEGEGLGLMETAGLGAGGAAGVAGIAQLLRQLLRRERKLAREADPALTRSIIS